MKVTHICFTGDEDRTTAEGCAKATFIPNVCDRPEYNYGPELVQGLIDGGAQVWVAGTKDLGLPGVKGFFPFHHTDAETVQRGKAFSLDSTFQWLYERDLTNLKVPAAWPMITETIMSIRQACIMADVTPTQVEDIFCNNAMRLFHGA